MRFLVVLALITACGDDGPSSTVYFDLDGSIAEPATFWNLPFPSDLRLAASGAPDMTGFPNPRNVSLLAQLVSVVEERRGWPTMPTAYVRFTAPVPERALADVLGDEVTLIDIDEASPERGQTFPIVARTLTKDAYVTDWLVALAPRPGITLRPGTRYAYVVREAFAPGFVAPAGFADLAAGRTPTGARGAEAAALYAPLWSALELAGIPKADVLVATVFTTGDEVARVRARSEAIRSQFQPRVEGLALVGGATHDGFCQLAGT
ncbi:MAG TPA: hypothetical protein VIU61_04860, partial [Kofleriaceae bacterium]